MKQIPTNSSKIQDSGLSFVTIENDEIVHCLENNQEMKQLVETFIQKIRPRVSALIQEGVLKGISLVKTNIHCCLMLILKRNVGHTMFLDEFNSLEAIYNAHIQTCVSETLPITDIIEKFVIDHEM